MVERKERNGARKDVYITPKNSFKMSNGSENINPTFPSMETERRKNCCQRLVHFIRHDQKYSLYCLSETNPVRKLCRFIVDSKVFEYFILLNIVANCVVLALNKPLPKNDRIEMFDKLEEAEQYFLIVFCIEAVLKIVAYGFTLHPGSYLRNGWNVLDFIVVVVGIVELAAKEIVKVRSLRAIRVLRPLKLISGVPSLQVVMKSIGRAMVPLLQIALLVIFVIVIYAIIGMEFLRDKFHYTCQNNVTKKIDKRPCDVGPYNGVRQLFHGRICSEDYRNDKDPWLCVEMWEGPNSGITTFDNIFLSMITVFQCVTNEGWTDIMYYTFQAIDEDGYLYSIYFVSLIVIGSFFMLNLVLGVLSGEFAKERERVETRRAFFKVRRQEQIDREVAGYIEWITKAEEVITKEQGRKDVDRSIVEPSESQAHIICNDLVINPMAVLTKPVGNIYRLNIPERRNRMDIFRLLETRFRISLRKAVKSQWFYWAVLVCVFLNTVSLATEHYNQPDWLGEFQQWAEWIFLGIFTIEMIIKMYSLGIAIYFSSSFNIFDCVVVCSGLIETTLTVTIKLNLGISVLRCLRLLRLFKVTRHWTSLRNLATSLVSSIKSIISLIFLLFLFILISALLGMQVFGGKFSEKKAERTNFDNFQNSMLTVFQILTGEDWNAVMYTGIMAHGGPHSATGIAVSLYFVLLVIVGNYTLLNVFLAIAVDNLANAQILTEDEENEEKERQRKREETSRMYSENTQKAMNQQEPEITNRKGSHWAKTKSIPKILMLRNKLAQNKDDAEDGTAENETGAKGARRNDRKRFSETLGKKIELYRREDSLYSKKANGQLSDVDGNASDEGQGRVKRRVRTQRGGGLGRGRGRAKSQSDGEGGKTDEPNDDDDEDVTARNFMHVLKTGRFGNRRRRVHKDVPIIKTKALFIFGPDNCFRSLCHRIVCLAHFDNFMLLIIMLSSLVIALEDPVIDDAHRNKILWYFDCVFTAIFVFEVVIKVIDMGLIFHKGAYLRSWWNVIDFVVVVCNLASLILSQRNDRGKVSSYIGGLRVMRVLRPFKSVHKIKKLQAVFRCMWFSVKNVVNILMITMLFLFIFAVMGVQLFNGKFSQCTDEAKLTKDECKGEYFKYNTADGDYTMDFKDATNEPRKWDTEVFNFDNVYNAMLTLYTSSTGEGWPSAMQRTIDTTEKDRGKVQDSHTEYAIYYVSFVVVFSFFFLNIFVALIILTFQDLGEKEISNCELDRNQRDCIHFALTAKPAQMYMPRDKKTLQYYVWKVAMSKPFDILIMALISLNTIVLMMQYHTQSAAYKEACNNLNIAFTSLFTVEAILKLIALRVNYFRDYWNVFDCIVVVGGIIDILITQYGKNYSFIDPRMFRLFRAARLIKLLRQGYTIRILLWTFLRSFKALPYVTLLILLQFFMYAVVGMQLFGKIELKTGTEIDKFNNFTSILMALELLFRSATGENWHLIMKGCFTDAKCNADIKPSKNQTCGNTPLAVIYFCSFIFLCMFLMLNLFVAVIMDNFEYLTRDESILGPHHLDEFVRVWSEYDPSASGCIRHSEIYGMMCSMSPPVGFGKKCPRIVGYKRLIKMNMPVDEDGAVTFNTTLFALIRTSLNIKLKGNMNANDTELRNLMRRLWPKATQKKVLDKLIPKQSVLSSQQMTIGKIYCAKLIHENYKYSKRKAEGGIERGFLRNLVGSIRGYQDGSDHPVEDGHVKNPHYLSAPSRPRSKTIDDSHMKTENESKTPSDTSSNLHGEHLNSVGRSRSWSSKANGDLEMIELKPVPSKKSRNGKPRTSDEGSAKPVVPLTYLTCSPKPDRTARNNSYTIAVDLNSNDDEKENEKESNPHVEEPEMIEVRRQSRDSKYYDDMITRINEQLTHAVESGQSPYAIYGMSENDENEWC